MKKTVIFLVSIVVIIFIVEINLALSLFVFKDSLKDIVGTTYSGLSTFLASIVAIIGVCFTIHFNQRMGIIRIRKIKK